MGSVVAAGTMTVVGHVVFSTHVLSFSIAVPLTFLLMKIHAFTHSFESVEQAQADE